MPYGEENPYQRLLVEHLRALGVTVEVANAKGLWPLRRAMTRRGRPDVLHLHWIHPLVQSRGRVLSALRGSAILFQLTMLKASGVRIVWTAHNLRGHERRYRRIESTLTARIAGLADAVISHCDDSRNELIRAYPRRDPSSIVVVPHGHYADFYPAPPSAAESRRRLGLPADALVFLNVGPVRPYKGLTELVDAFTELNDPKTCLLMAGAVKDEQLGERLRVAAERTRGIHFRPGYVPDEMLALHLAAADVIVLPYRDILSSGGAILAMSFGRAVIAPRLGCIPHTVFDDVGLLYDPADSRGLVNAMRTAIDHRDHIGVVGETNRTRALVVDWPLVARLTNDVYSRVSTLSRSNG